MIGKDSKRNGYVSLSEVLEILESRKKDKELTYEQQIAFEHATKFASAKSDSKIRKGLQELGILSDQTVISILDVMPKNMALLKQILATEKRTFSDEEVKKVLSLINQK
jgi:DNA-directed RNA polymerase subunit F